MKQSMCEFGWSGSLPGKATGAVGDPAETRKHRGDMLRHLDVVGVSSATPLRLFWAEGFGEVGLLM